MKRIIKIDPYFSEQPPLRFIDDLKKPVHEEADVPEYFGRKPCLNDEIDITGAYLAVRFDDEKNLLETAYLDFENFMRVYKISGNEKLYPIIIRYCETECHEAYSVSVTEKCTEITAADTDGIRRALIWLEDEMQSREGPYLKIGSVSRRPYIRSRITRCFFSPINRPPKYGDELSDDIDYYPDEYLNRIAHDGANGVWIYTRFSDILPSSYIIENGKGYESRIAKLNRVIAKCARYGIKVYVFAIEPVALTAEQAQKYPELAGSKIWNNSYTFCTNTEKGRKFCEEATERMFTLCPDLGGYISITYGERMTSCTSMYKNNSCPRCKDEPSGVNLARTLDALRSGMRKAKPEADFISWTYGHRIWNFDDIRDYVKAAPDDVMLMQNFDDMGYEEQLGIMRQCVDYWLSYVGPSELFEITAEQARESGKHMFAKMQVCCSHEVASVPYIPAPGILYQKYKGARKYNVEGIMQCWYFGNYPSLMSKAAGELSFIDKFDDEEGFLKRLASIYWGRSNSEAVVSAWKNFAASYRQYPMNVMFSYYGPMHDGVVWELQLKPKNFSLPRTWQTLDPADGDRICESLLNGHTLDEALTLVSSMCGYWAKGLADLNNTFYKNKEQLSVINALNILFSSGRNILEFYKLRDELGRGDTSVFMRMRELIYNEINNSREMIVLCKNDGRLGYHSEGEGYKFFPEKLEHRIEQLEKLLNTEFAEVQLRIESGLPPLEYYEGIEPDSKSYKMNSGKWESFGTCAFKADYDSEKLYIELKSEKPVSFTLAPEYNLMWTDVPISISPEGRVSLSRNAALYFSVFGEREKREYAKYSDVKAGDTIKLTLDLKDIGIEKIRPMKLKITASNGDGWCHEDNPVVTLGKSEVSPGDYGWLMP